MGFPDLIFSTVAHGLSCTANRKTCELNTSTKTYDLAPRQSMIVTVGAAWVDASILNGVMIEISATSAADSGYVIADGSSLYSNTRVFTPFSINGSKPF